MQQKTIQTDVVKLLNPKLGTRNKIFLFPVSRYNETSHERMKMIYSTMVESLQFVKADDQGRYTALSNTRKRKVYFRCDGLSSRNFSALPINLTWQMSQIDSAQHGMPLIETSKNTTVFHDYFHETQMHQPDCIWRSKYACFLQPFQVHLSWKRINGEPAKENMRSHEIFPIYESMPIHRFGCFLPDQIIVMGSEPPNNLMAIEIRYILITVMHCFFVHMNLVEFVLFS